MDLKRVGCLYRVSTLKQVEKNDIPMQRISCGNFIKSHNNWKLTKEYIELGVSGYKLSESKRDVLQDIKRDVLNKEIDILLVFMFDRIGRREEETPFVVEWLIDNGVEVWSVKEGQRKLENRADKLINYITYWQAGGESEKTSIRVREAQIQMAEKGIQIIMTTHSPYLLEHIKNGNIRIVSRMGNIAMVTKPDDNMMAEDILGVSQNYMGTLFVEDRVAYDFLSIILEDKAPYILKRYTIDIAEGGEKAISCRLEFPASDRIKYDFIGVYDGDMRNHLNTEKLQWKWVFLPGNKPLEELYREYLHNAENIKKFCDSMGKSDSQIITMLATIDGNDHHDWFEELRKFLGVDGRMLVRVFYNIMQDMSEGIDSFISDLKSCINH